MSGYYPSYPSGGPTVVVTTPRCSTGHIVVAWILAVLTAQPYPYFQPSATQPYPVVQPSADQWQPAPWDRPAGPEHRG